MSTLRFYTSNMTKIQQIEEQQMKTGKIVSDYIILKEDAQGVRMFVPTAYDYHQMLKELENF